MTPRSLVGRSAILGIVAMFLLAPFGGADMVEDVGNTPNATLDANAPTAVSAFNTAASMVYGNPNWPAGLKPKAAYAPNGVVTVWNDLDNDNAQDGTEQVLFSNDAAPLNIRIRNDAPEDGAAVCYTVWNDNDDDGNVGAGEPSAPVCQALPPASAEVLFYSGNFDGASCGGLEVGSVTLDVVPLGTPGANPPLGGAACATITITVDGEATSQSAGLPSAPPGSFLGQVFDGDFDQGANACNGAEIGGVSLSLAPPGVPTVNEPDATARCVTVTLSVDGDDVSQSAGLTPGVPPPPPTLEVAVDFYDGDFEAATESCDGAVIGDAGLGLFPSAGPTVNVPAGDPRCATVTLSVDGDETSQSAGLVGAPPANFLLQVFDGELNPDTSSCGGIEIGGASMGLSPVGVPTLEPPSADARCVTLTLDVDGEETSQSVGVGLGDVLGGAVDIVQNLLHDTIADGLTTIAGLSGGAITVLPGPNNDGDVNGAGDPRTDYYYVREVAGASAVCEIVQSDFIDDARSSYQIVPLDDEGMPATSGLVEPKLTAMVFVRNPMVENAGAGVNCPTNAAPNVVPTRITGHAEVFLAEDPLAAPDGDGATRLVIYDQADVKTLSVKVFNRANGPGVKNPGLHVVLGVHNPPSLASFDPNGEVSEVFMQPFDLTDVHLLSGINLNIHDSDDDGSNDATELLTLFNEDFDPCPAPPESFKSVNPLNKKSTPSDFDGDGVANCGDDDPYVANPFGWQIVITAPAADSTQSGDVTVSWTATKTNPNALPIDQFEIFAQRLNDAGDVVEESIAVDGADASNTVSRSITWDSHQTRFDLGLIDDNDYKIRVVATNGPGDEVGGIQDEAFTLANFDYTVTITFPEGGEDLRETIPITWTITPDHPNQLPIDHIDLIAWRTDPNQPEDDWTIGDDLAASTRSFDWNTVAHRIAEVPGEEDLADQDYNLRLTILDAADVDAPQAIVDELDERFNLVNSPAPAINAQDAVDANGGKDDGVSFTGAVRVDYTIDAGRPDDDARASWETTIELHRCWTNVAAHGPLLETFVVEDATPGAHTFTVPDATIRQHFGEGRRFNCPDVGAALINPGANDGRGRVVIRVKEIQAFPEFGGDLEATSGDVTDDFVVFNNLLPGATEPTAVRLDIGGQTSTGLLPSGLGGSSLPSPVGDNQVRFRIKVQDRFMGCINNGNAPTSVTLKIFHEATGQLAVPAKTMVRSQDPQVNPGHAATCTAIFPAGSSSVPPWNSDLNQGIVYEASVALPIGSYLWNVTVVDRHGNQLDGVTGQVISATQSFPVANAAVNLFQPVDQAMQALQNAITMAEGQAACDLNNDGAPANECEDLEPMITQLINQAASNPAAKLPHPLLDPVCGGPLDSLCNFDDTDQDLDNDADELNAGSDPYNPYSRITDRDADLVLDVLERGVQFPVKINGVLDVNLYRIQWVQDADPTKPCFDEGAYAGNDACHGKLTVFESGKFVEIRPATGAGHVLRVQEMPGNLVLLTTSQAGGFSWTLVDGLLDVDVGERLLHVQANWSDGQRAVELTLDYGSFGSTTNPILALTVLGGASKPPVTGNVNPVNTLNGQTRTLKVFTNPVEITINNDKTLDDVGALPAFGTFLDEAGLPVMWVDKNGNDEFDSGEQVTASIDDVDNDGFTNSQELAGDSNPFYAGSTPDDPETPEDENGDDFPDDWDGDGWTNAQELTASPLGGPVRQSNPLQQCSTPKSPNGWPLPCE